MKAGFLTDQERKAAVERIKQNETGIEDKHWKNEQVGHVTCKLPLTLLTIASSSRLCWMRRLGCCSSLPLHPTPQMVRFEHADKEMLLTHVERRRSHELPESYHQGNSSLQIWG